MRATSSAGIFGGPMKAIQLVRSMPGMPCSASVGTSGAASMRLGEATATMRMRPVCAFWMAVGAASKYACTRPSSRSRAASAVPLYGTCVTSMPAALANAMA